MANHQVTGSLPRINHVDRRRANLNSAGIPGSSHGASHAGRVQSITDLRTRLTAIDASAYSASRLDTMTVNDMIFAVRLADEAAGI